MKRLLLLEDEFELIRKMIDDRKISGILTAEGKRVAKRIKEIIEDIAIGQDETGKWIDEIDEYEFQETKISKLCKMREDSNIEEEIISCKSYEELENARKKLISSFMNFCELFELIAHVDLLLKAEGGYKNIKDEKDWRGDVRVFEWDKEEECDTKQESGE